MNPNQLPRWPKKKGGDFKRETICKRWISNGVYMCVLCFILLLFCIVLCCFVCFSILMVCWFTRSKVTGNNVPKYEPKKHTWFKAGQLLGYKTCLSNSHYGQVNVVMWKIDENWLPPAGYFFWRAQTLRQYEASTVVSWTWQDNRGEVGFAATGHGWKPWYCSVTVTKQTEPIWTNPWEPQWKNPLRWVDCNHMVSILTTISNIWQVYTSAF